MSDPELVAGFLASRDEASFRTLYRRHTPYLYRLALRLAGGDAAQAEELVQDAWIRAVGALDRFRGDSALRTWLAGFVVNCHRERRRRARLEQAHLEPSAAPEPGEPAGVIDAEAAIRALPETLREVLVLHAFEGYTHEEIARLLAIPAGTSKSRLFDARRALRLSLGLVATGGATP